jgi:hypothetical protein
MACGTISESSPFVDAESWFRIVPDNHWRARSYIPEKYNTRPQSVWQENVDFS